MEQALRGKIILITGATSGIGQVTATRLAAQGGTVVIVGRDESKTRVTAQAIQKQAPDGDVQTLLADLSSQAQIRALAQEAQRKYPHLDVLINNAGAVFSKRQLTVDGLEMTLAVNHLAPFLLTNLLLDMLKSSPSARVVTVASAAHVGTRIPFDDLNYEKDRYRSFIAYGQSKLANIMFTYELARRMKGSNITANTLHPGIVATNFGKSNGGYWNAIFALISPFEISPERGAQTSIYLASSPDIANVTGQYFAKSKPVRSSKASYELAAQQRLWSISEQLTGATFPTAM